MALKERVRNQGRLFFSLAERFSDVFPALIIPQKHLLGCHFAQTLQKTLSLSQRLSVCLSAQKYSARPYAVFQNFVYLKKQLYRPWIFR